MTFRVSDRTKMCDCLQSGCTILGNTLRPQPGPSGENTIFIGIIIADSQCLLCTGICFAYFILMHLLLRRFVQK